MGVIAQTAADFQNGGDASVKYAAERYGLQQVDVKQWFEACRWHAQPSLQEETLVQVVESLKAIIIIIRT